MQAIYQIKNKINGKIYIGSTNNINKRWTNHRCKLRKGEHENNYLQQAWKKYGEDAFQFSILEEVNGNNRIEREIHYLNETKCYEREIGYNLDKNPKDKSGSKNPFYGKKHRQEIIEKIKIAANNRSEETKKRMGDSHKGEKSNTAKLNWEEVREIRRLYLCGTETHRSLSTKYNVTKGTIQAILERKSWKE
jgi:group I intron endonuclease